MNGLLKHLIPNIKCQTTTTYKFDADDATALYVLRHQNAHCPLRRGPGACTTMDGVVPV